MKANLPPETEVAVIGAGVSGLVAAKRLAEEGFAVTLYDRRKYTGGTWNSSKLPEDPNSKEAQGRFPSAVYAGLQTNFPRQLMELQDHPFDRQPLFMSHENVLKYLQDYSKTIHDVRFRSDKEVTRLYYTTDANATNQESIWHLTTRDVSTGLEVTKNFRAVVAAVGVFEQPFTPDFEGLKDWKEIWPGTISHAKEFRSASRFRGKKVLIVGYAASGFDIARLVAPHATKLYVSSRRMISDQVPPGTEVRADIKCFDHKNRVVVFKDGHTIWRVDHVIFCTGYTFSQPFIKRDEGSDVPLFPDGFTVDNLYEHMIFKDSPSLAFVGLIKGGAPTFLLVQAQAAFLSRFWAGRLSVKPTAAIQTVTSDDGDDDDAEARHELPFPKFMDYLLRLEKACVAADRGLRYDGNLPFRWTLAMDWIRQNRREIREAFMKNEERDRRFISTLSQLGFDDQSLSPSSQNINLVVPFLAVQAGYFTGRHEQLLDAFFPSQDSERMPFLGLGFFVQVKNIFESTLGDLDGSGQRMFQVGAKRLLEFGLTRLEEAVVDNVRSAPPCDFSGGAGTVLFMGNQKRRVFLLNQQKEMMAIYTELFGTLYGRDF